MLKYASVRDSYQSQTSAPSSAGHYGYQNDVTTSNPSYPRSSNHDNQLRNTMDSNASTLKGISSLQSETSGPEERSSEKKTYSGMYIYVNRHLWKPILVCEAKFGAVQTPVFTELCFPQRLFNVLLY